MATRWELHGIWASGPAYTIGLALALLGEPFDYVHVDLRTGAHKQPDYLARQRFGQVPLLVDRTTGQNLCQSASILEHLADTTGRFGGSSPAEGRETREWLMWTWDKLARGVYRVRAAKRGFGKFPPDVLAHYETEGPAALAFLDAHLEGRSWIVGSGPTIADIAAYGVAAYAGEAGYDLAAYPAVAAWAARLEGLPGFKGKDDLLPQESRAAA